MAKKKSEQTKELDVQSKSEIVETVIPEYQFITTEDAKKLSDEELTAKIEELETSATSFGDEIKNKKYNVQVGTLKNVRGLYKFLEKNIKWSHNTLPGYISVCHGLKDAITEGVTEDGFIKLHSSPVGMIYQQMIQVTGTGYFEAREYLKVLTEVGSGISDSMKELADDNTQLRNIHTDLSALDTEKIARTQGIEVAETPIIPIDSIK